MILDNLVKTSKMCNFKCLSKDLVENWFLWLKLA